jgi:hypothetical protein
MDYLYIYVFGMWMQSLILHISLDTQLPSPGCLARSRLPIGSSILVLISLKPGQPCTCTIKPAPWSEVSIIAYGSPIFCVLFVEQCLQR